MFCQSPIWAWKWSSSLVSPYLFWYLATSNIPLLQLTQFTKKINTKYLHEKEKSKEIDGLLFRRAQNTGMSRTFHQHRHRCKQLVQHGWYLTLSLCGNDDQLASGGKHRHSKLKNERHWPREKTSRVLSNRATRGSECTVEESVFFCYLFIHIQLTSKMLKLLWIIHQEFHYYTKNFDSWPYVNVFV